MKSFYLATRKDRESEANALSEALKAKGWHRTFTWSAQLIPGKHQQSETARLEIEAVKAADVLIALLPGGFGTHVEIGAALAMGKPVILHAPNDEVLNDPYPCVFHYHPGVKLIVSDQISPEAILAEL